MTDIWSGDILLPDDQIVKDIGLASQNSASAPVITTTSLRFLATVNTACIPLYLAAGPSLDVWTTDEETEAWFASILLSKPPTASGAPAEGGWWEYARTQSPVGILVGISEEVAEGEDRINDPRVTEILLYGTIAKPAKRILPTPPSSSPENPYDQSEQLPELRVHALPLSSDLVYRDTVVEVPDAPDALLDTEPQFISTSRTTSNTDHTTPTSPKRKRDVFDEAAQRRKKARAKGGEGVAAAAARTHDTQKPYLHRRSLSIETKGIPLSDSRPNSAHAAHPSPRLLSRSPSITSDTRPSSRRGTLDGQSKRSNLSHVATIPIQPEEPTTETRNKEALSRVVMAAMRMHGLEQKKKTKSRRGSIAPGVEEDMLTEEAAAEEAAKDEEYKLIYHQTYKGAALALRKHMGTKPLHTQPDRLGDVVERLLAIFCTDPLAQPLPGDILVDPLATPGSKDKLGVPNSTHNRHSPFDIPSASRLKPTRTPSTDQINNGSPVSRRDQAAPH